MNERKLTSRDLARAQTREALLTSARKLVAERGFGGVSVGDVAADAGFTKGAFYSNFDSREAMLLELFQRLHSEQQAAMRALEADTLPDLARALDQLAEMAVRHATSPTASLLTGEVQLQARRDSDFSEKARAGFDRQLNAFVAWIDNLMKSDGVRSKLPSRQLARTVMALSQGLAQQPADHNEVRGIVRAVLERVFAPRVPD